MVGAAFAFVLDRYRSMCVGLSNGTCDDVFGMAGDLIEKIPRHVNGILPLEAIIEVEIISPKPVNVNAIVSTIEKLLKRLIGEEIELFRAAFECRNLRQLEKFVENLT